MLPKGHPHKKEAILKENSSIISYTIKGIKCLNPSLKRPNLFDLGQFLQLTQHTHVLDG